MNKLFLVPAALLLSVAAWTVTTPVSEGDRSFDHTSAIAADADGVRAAVLDYVEGIYEVDPGRIERSVHRQMAKRGFYTEASGDYGESPMTYEQLHALAGTWNRDGRVDPATALKEVHLYEVLDQTASAKLVADWGIDYMHLAKYDGKWMIVNVLWQSHPTESP